MAKKYIPVNQAKFAGDQEQFAKEVANFVLGFTKVIQKPNVGPINPITGGIDIGSILGGFRGMLSMIAGYNLPTQSGGMSIPGWMADALITIGIVAGVGGAIWAITGIPPWVFLEAPQQLSAEQRDKIRNVFSTILEKIPTS